MKKKLLLLFTAGVLATLTACGSSDAATATNSTVETADAADSEVRTVRLVTAGVDEPPSLIHNDGTWTGIDAGDVGRNRETHRLECRSKSGTA